MKSPWHKSEKPKYQQQEARTAKKRGARAQVNSGRTWSSLRDVVQDTVIGRILIDNKTTDAASYTITTKDWAALKRDANRMPPGHLPALQIDIRLLRLMVIEEDVWDEIMDRIDYLENLVASGQG